MQKLLLTVMAVIFIASCARDDGQKGVYVAKINGVSITKEDVMEEMNNLPDIAREFFKGQEGVERFVDELIKKEMLYIEAKKRGLDKNKEFERQVEEFKKITLINKLLEQEMEALAKVTEQDMKDYYEKNKHEFMMTNQVRLSHIIVKTEEDTRKVYERIQKGDDFGKIAAEMSIDKATSKSGGDLGSFKRGDMVPELEEIAFSLRKGEVSMPLRVRDGFQILKVTDAKGPIAEFTKAKELIRQNIIAKRQREGFDNLLKNLEKKHKVEINKEVLSKITFTQPEK